MNRSLLLITSAILIMTSCFSNAAFAEKKKVDWSAIKTFTVLETADPDQFRMRNFMPASILALGVGIPVSIYRNKEMSEKFGVLIKEKPIGMANAMRQQVISSLAAGGLTEIPPPVVQVDPKDPNNIDYGKIKTQADAIIHVFFDEAGIESPTFSVMYRPQIAATICVVVQKVDNDCVFSEGATYGAKKDDVKKGEVASAENEQWDSENTVYGQMDAVRDALRSGSALAGIALANLVRQPLGLPPQAIIRAQKSQTIVSGSPSNTVSPPSVTVADGRTSQPDPIKASNLSSQNTTTQSNSAVAGKLRELNALRNEGLISEAEYNSKRNAVLSTFDTRADH